MSLGFRIARRGDSERGGPKKHEDVITVQYVVLGDVLVFQKSFFSDEQLAKGPTPPKPFQQS